jgi:uncharacterized membrane protein
MLHKILAYYHETHYCNLLYSLSRLTSTGGKAVMANQNEISELRSRVNALQFELDSIRKKLDETGMEAEAAIPAAPTPAVKPHKTSRVSAYLRTRVIPEFEQLVGGNIIGKLGLLTLVLATAWFIKYAFDRQWINESGRIYTGLVAGFGVIVFGLHLARGRLRIIAHSIIGTGCAILYVAVFGAYYYYSLLGRHETFIALFILSACIALIAARADSQILYLFSLAGAFLAPVLMSRGENSYRFLFGYLALVNAGYLAISFKRYWRVAPFILLGADALVYAMWAAENITRSSFTVPFLYILFIFTLFMAVEIAIIPRRWKSISRAAIILLTANIFLFLWLGIWTVNEFHVNLRPHFILFVSGTLALSYFAFNYFVKGVGNEKQSGSN